MSVPTPGYDCEIMDGVHVVTFCDEKQIGEKRTERIERLLCELVDGDVERLVLDFRNVTFINSRFVGMIIVVTNRVFKKHPFSRRKTFRERNWRAFEIYDDREDALAALSNPESMPYSREIADLTAA